MAEPEQALNAELATDGFDLALRIGALAEMASGPPKFKDHLRRAMRHAENAAVLSLAATVRELDHDLNEDIGCINSCQANIFRYSTGDPRWPEWDYGFGTTAEEAIERQRSEIIRLERARADDEEALLDLGGQLWESLFPGEGGMPEEQTYAPKVGVKMPFNPALEIKARVWEEIYNEFGDRWASDGQDVSATDICVVLYGLGLETMIDLLLALRDEDVKRVTEIAAQVTNNDRQKGYGFYNVLYAVRGEGGRLRLRIDQRRNILCAQPRHGPRFALRRARRWGARQRSSRGRAVRTRGSRRVQSRSAGGGSSGSDPPGAKPEIGPTQRGAYV